MARDRFETALGRPALWDGMEGRKATRVVLLSEFTSVTEVEQWPAMIDWLIDGQARLRAALTEVGGIPSVLP